MSRCLLYSVVVGRREARGEARAGILLDLGPPLPLPSAYGWAFGLPEIFGSGSSGFRNFGFPKMIPEISWEKEEPENSGTRKFGFGFGFYPNYPKFWNSTYAV